MKTKSRSANQQVSHKQLREKLYRLDMGLLIVITGFTVIMVSVMINLTDGWGPFLRWPVIFILTFAVSLVLNWVKSQLMAILSDLTKLHAGSTGEHDPTETNVVPGDETAQSP